MKIEIDQITAILYKHFGGRLLNGDEKALLEQWLKQSSANQVVFDQIQDEKEIDRYLSIVMDDRHTDNAFRMFKINTLKEADDAGEKVLAMPSVHRIHFLKTMLVRYVAAIIIISFGIGGYLWINNYSKRSTVDTVQPAIGVNDVPAGRNGAILTLADGSKIVLDSMGSGLVAHQNGTEAVLKDGHLAYHPKGKSTDNVTYNVMSTPKGRQFQVTLPDGTKVWLNAASSLRFPTVFAGKDRTVELTGEGYFEVAHNSAMPFHVKVNDMTITVLGTHFDINSYSDEPAVKTTLLQGRILVNRKDKLVYLNPGQQAVVVPDEKDIKINYNVDVAEVMAWKNGRFIFNNADIRTIMRQVKRWYDVEVEYEGKISTEEFVGGISMQNNISELLKVLQGTNLVRFKMIGKKVIVTP